MKLAVAPQYQPSAIEIGCDVLGRKQHMPGGHTLLLSMLDGGPDEGLGHRFGVELRTQQETRTRNGRERHRRQQLRVVAQTLLRIGAGPREIENELAPRVRFAKQWQRGRELSGGIFNDEMLRTPAGARRGAAGFLQRQEKLVPQEGLRGAR